jgi:hypothetical protein
VHFQQFLSKGWEEFEAKHFFGACVLALALFLGQFLLTTLFLLVFVLIVPPVYQLGWSLALAMSGSL